jgi:hypothetical protein
LQVSRAAKQTIILSSRNYKMYQLLLYCSRIQQKRSAWKWQSAISKHTYSLVAVSYQFLSLRCVCVCVCVCVHVCLHVTSLTLHQILNPEMSVCSLPLLKLIKMPTKILSDWHINCTIH